MGVVFPVSTPSIVTFAPDGNEVTFSTPVCPAAESTVAASARQTASAKKMSLPFPWGLWSLCLPVDAILLPFVLTRISIA